MNRNEAIMRLLTLVFLMLLGLQTNAASLTARVDRTQLSLDETLELTLETDDTTMFGKPDLQPLDGLFRVFGSRQLNQLSSVNGQARATTQWLITLQPQQTGYVVIPPLQIGELSSKPITLHVRETSAEEGDRLSPIFIDASLDQDSVYVQAQIVLTLRIYHSVSLYDDSTLSPLQMSDALVERLDEPRTYEKNINGIRHGVIEIRYALFPQKKRCADHSVAAVQRHRSCSRYRRPLRFAFWPFNPGQITDHPAAGQAQAGRIPGGHALAAGNQPDPGRSLEPGTRRRQNRRSPDTQRTAQSRGPDQRPAAAASVDPGAWPARLP